MKSEKNGFYKFVVPLGEDKFGELLNSVVFEDVGKGRKGNHLVDVGEKGVPIVRTTTKYEVPACPFAGIHREIVEGIKSETILRPGLEGVSLGFNNALIEVYDSTYFKMGYHSDQCLDLEAGSFIALFSCYERPDDLSKNTLRKLKVKSKTTEEEFEFTLENNSVILFSLATNAKFQHKIVLEPRGGAKSAHSENRWLGVTFRRSKTFVQFREGLPYFANGELLRLADGNESREFYGLRGLENAGVDFEYPEIGYTLSVGDMLEPTLSHRAT